MYKSNTYCKLVVSQIHTSTTLTNPEGFSIMSRDNGKVNKHTVKVYVPRNAGIAVSVMSRTPSRDFDETAAPEAQVEGPADGVNNNIEQLLAAAAEAAESISVDDDIPDNEAAEEDMGNISTNAANVDEEAEAVVEVYQGNEGRPPHPQAQPRHPGPNPGQLWARVRARLYKVNTEDHAQCGRVCKIRRF